MSLWRSTDKGPTGPEGPSKRIEVAKGATNASGLYSVVYSPAFDAAPVLAIGVLSATAGCTYRITAESAAGCTVIVEKRSETAVLGIPVLGPSMLPVAGATVNITATEPD